MQWIPDSWQHSPNALAPAASFLEIFRLIHGVTCGYCTFSCNKHPSFGVLSSVAGTHFLTRSRKWMFLFWAFHNLVLIVARKIESDPCMTECPSMERKNNPIWSPFAVSPHISIILQKLSTLDMDMTSTAQNHGATVPDCRGPNSFSNVLMMFSRPDSLACVALRWLHADVRSLKLSLQ